MGGVTNFGDNAEDFPEKLLEVEVPIVSNEVCKEALLGLATILPGMLCAGGVANEDACGGDSGGPFTVEGGGKHTLAVEGKVCMECMLRWATTGTGLTRPSALTEEPHSAISLAIETYTIIALGKRKIGEP